MKAKQYITHYGQQASEIRSDILVSQAKDGDEQTSLAYCAISWGKLLCQNFPWMPARGHHNKQKL